MHDIAKTCIMFLALFYTYSAIRVCVYVCVIASPMAFVKCPLCALDCIKIFELRTFRAGMERNYFPFGPLTKACIPQLELFSEDYYLDACASNL